jgi:UDP-N-acetylmuramate--alanine ligase
MKYHFVGIGGIGMSALARILLQRGAQVQGSDLSASYVTKDLQMAGAVIFSDHQPSHVVSPCTVIYNTQIKKDHPEYLAATHQQLPILHRSDLLAQLMKGSKTLLVTGTHGKTTTSCLLAYVLHVAEMEPTYALGGVALNFNSNGDHGAGEYFVAEADESDGTFLKYPSFGAIISNVEEDHLDHWGTREALINGFRDFASNVQELLWWNGDDKVLQSLHLKGKTFGFGPSADVQIKHWTQEGWSLQMTLLYQGQESFFELPLLGEHNVMNAAAVFGIAIDLGIPVTVIQKAFKTFKGVKRRMEKKGESRGAVFYDDYAHHPTEIATTLQGVRKAIGEKRLIAVFQPHRFTRLRDCWKEFLTCFTSADIVFIADVYSAREEPIPGVNAEKFYQEMKELAVFPVYYLSQDNLISFLRPHDVVVTLGAGDITDLSSEMTRKGISPYRVAICQGGKSAEHEVSLRSAKRIMESMNPEYYTIAPFTISKKGDWFLGVEEKTLPEVIQELLKCDFVFPVLHGPFGEDGMIQGFLETIGIPYIGADFRSCAVCMDKAWTKHIAARHGCEVARFIEFSTHAWEQKPAETLKTILQRFQFPFYVKAVHLGSTFGVHRVKNQQDVIDAIENILKLDYRFLVEEEVNGRELEFGFIGNYDAAVSDPAEVIRAGEIHTYENKYSASGNPSITKAPMPTEVLERGRQIAKAVYEAVGCTGFARIDFFLKDDGTWVLNEINPIPGFTPTSVYPEIWIAEGVPLSQVVDRVIIAGLHRKRYLDRHLRPPKQPPVQL